MLLLILLGICLILTYIVDLSFKHKYSILLLKLWLLLLWIVAAFRFHVGNDYVNYAFTGLAVNRFSNLQDMLNFVETTRIEVGIVIISCIANIIVKNFQCIFVATAFIQILILYYCIRDYLDKNYYILALCIYYYFFYFTSLNIIRQSVAVLICIYSLRFIVQKKLIFFVINILIAILFHKSAILFLPAYLINNIKISRFSVFLYIFGIILFSYVFDDLIFIGQNIFGFYENYSIESRSGGIISLITSLIILIPSIYIYLVHKNEYSLKDETIVKLYFFGTIIGFFSIQFFYFNRIALYYKVFIIFSLPIIYSYSKYKINKQCFLMLYFTLNFLISVNNSQDLFLNKEKKYQFNPIYENNMIKWREEFYELY